MGPYVLFIVQLYCTVSHGSVIKGNSSQEFLLYLHKIVKISFSMQYARILHRHS
eukprot:COSAG05_NODE_13537_length_426_cov_1.015291_1_plen_53_part_01